MINYRLFDVSNVSHYPTDFSMVITVATGHNCYFNKVKLNWCQQPAAIKNASKSKDKFWKLTAFEEGPISAVKSSLNW